MDDVFAVICVRRITPFLHLLNIQNPGGIKFTHEVEDLSLPFLDLLVNRTDEGFLSTRVYRKPTYTDLLLNFDSHHPDSVKK